MTEIEKIAYAKGFLDKLANGINPIDDIPVAESDIVNQVRISRCLFYVSDILRQVIENGGVAKPVKKKKRPFGLSMEQLMGYEYALNPIPVSEIAKRLNALAEPEEMQKITHRHITQWLLNVGILCMQDDRNGKQTRRPTEAGLQLGLSVEIRQGRDGEYAVVLYNREAQQFILDHLDAICVKV